LENGGAELRGGDRKLENSRREEGEGEEGKGRKEGGLLNGFRGGG